MREIIRVRRELFRYLANAAALLVVGAATCDELEISAGGLEEFPANDEVDGGESSDGLVTMDSAKSVFLVARITS